MAFTWQEEKVDGKLKGRLRVCIDCSSNGNNSSDCLSANTMWIRVNGVRHVLWVKCNKQPGRMDWEGTSYKPHPLALCVNCRLLERDMRCGGVANRRSIRVTEPLGRGGLGEDEGCSDVEWWRWKL